jgi:hypothetical protein
MQYAALEKKRILNWQRRAEEKRRAEEEERRAELERTQKNAHLDAVRERNIENIVQRRSAQEEELLKKEKERQLIKEVKTRAFQFIYFIFFLPIAVIFHAQSPASQHVNFLFVSVHHPLSGPRKAHLGARTTAP